MLRHLVAAIGPGAAEATLRDLTRRLAEGEDPERAIKHLNQQIVAHQGAGAELPVSLIQMSHRLSAESWARRRARSHW